MTPSDHVSRRQAAFELGLANTHLANYVSAGEFGELAPRERLTREALAVWRSERPRVELSPEEYSRALRFAVAEFYLGGTRSDFGSSTRRTGGKFVDDYASGKLGEIAFARFLAEALDVDAQLDFEHHTGVPAQDIDRVRRVGRRSWNPPGVRVSIKTTKAGNVYLLVPEAEFTAEDRRSDVYVFVRVDLPRDHLIRSLYQAGGLEGVESELADQVDLLRQAIVVQAQVVGFAVREDFPAQPVSEIGSMALAAPNRAMQSGRLRTGPRNWAEFKSRILREESA